MTREHSSISLQDATGQWVTADLYEGITDENLQDHAKKWVPLLETRRAEALEARRTGRDAPIVEDAHWDWREKAKHARGLLAYKHVVIEAEGETQGIMQLELALHASRIEPPKSLTYVTYLSVAPWNRAPLVLNPKFKLVGSILFASAVKISFEEKFQGRVGLHSLPAAAGWYRKKGMQSFGPDADSQGLEYFELPKTTAREHLDGLSR